MRKLQAIILIIVIAFAINCKTSNSVIEATKSVGNSLSNTLDETTDNISQTAKNIDTAISSKIDEIFELNQQKGIEI